MPTRAIRYLRLLCTDHYYVTVEKTPPQTFPEREVVLLKHTDAHRAELLAQGVYSTPIEMPRRTFDRFVREQLLERTGDEGPPVFRVTEKGRTRVQNAQTGPVKGEPPR